MKFVTCTVLGIMLSILAIGSAPSQIPAAASGDSSLRSFLAQFEEGISRFINGDPTLWKQNASRRDDVTIMGAWGGFEKGLERSRPAIRLGGDSVQRKRRQGKGGIPLLRSQWRPGVYRGNRAK